MFSFLAGGLFLRCDHGLDIDIGLCENSIKIKIKTSASRIVELPIFALGSISCHAHHLLSEIVDALCFLSVLRNTKI